MKSFIHKILSSKTFVYWLNPWERIYSKFVPNDLSKPYEGFPEIVSFLRSAQAESVLDIAMGHGRHTLALIELGFKVSGFDYSPSAVKRAQEIIRKKHSAYNTTVFKQGNMFYKYPFEDESFDAAIAIQAIYHGFKNDMQKAINQAARVLKDGGLFIFTVSKDTTRSTVIKENLHKKKNHILKLLPNTYLPLSGRETGLIHFYPDKKMLREMLKDNFDHVIITDDEVNAYFVVKCNKKRKR